MSGNSLESLLARMKEGSITQGWGAVSVFSRSRINRLLEQQYIERFNGYGFIPAFSGRVSLKEGSYDNVELQDIALGQPLLSFNTASLTNSSAVLTMNIIAGRYSALRETPGAQATLLSEFNFTEPAGFKLEMDIDLSLVVGEIDRQGKVKLNLSDAVNFRCNIADHDDVANAQFSEFFKRRFAALPADRSVFELGMLDLKGYNHLTPQSFRIATQAAPGAKIKNALNYGDGGVVVFIRLRGNATDGRYPPDTNFPYLIPDNQEADGSERYSASLVLSEAMIPYVVDNQADILKNLLFPGQNVFEERERHTPRDLAVFGNVSAKQTRISLDPAFKTIKAGDTQRYTLRNWKGQEIQASQWSAVSLQSHTPEGHGTIVNGLYTSASKALIGHDSLHVVVTAEYVNEGITYTASALLLVAFDEMTVTPRVAVYGARTQANPIVLTASTAANATVTWSLLAPEYGALSQSAGQARFFPDARAKAKGLVVQRLEASGGEKRQASLVLVNNQQLLQVAPGYVPAIKAFTSVQLQDDTTLLPGATRRWKVISGGGTVDASGRFTAPAQGITSTSVVQCEIVRNGVILSSGYSVVGQSELEPEPTWKDLKYFTLKVPNGPEEGRTGRLFGNGYQQLRVQIRIETMPVGTKVYPLSATERSSIRLVDNISNSDLQFVDAALPGIPENDKAEWRTRRIANRFVMALPMMPSQDLPTRAEPEIVTTINLFLHSRGREGTSETFHAAFDAKDNNLWTSVGKSSLDGKINVTPLELPVFSDAEYSFVRERIDGGSGGGDPENPGEDDDFDFHLQSVDYWKLKYDGRVNREGTTFETVEFLDTQGVGTYASPSTSTVRWESEQLSEKMFSWTGYIFHETAEPDPTKPEIEPPEYVVFDESVKNVAPAKPLDITVVDRGFEKGSLVISLHRTDDVSYIRETNDPAKPGPRDKLSRDLAVRLIDKRGNTHYRRISFLQSGTVGNRNKLKHTLFTPGT